jgi:hypothetical protein
MDKVQKLSNSECYTPSSELNKNKAKNKTGKDTQIRFYKVIEAPTLMYESGNWALNTCRSEKRNI